jgi:hypothetical protein
MTSLLYLSPLYLSHSIAVFDLREQHMASLLAAPDPAVVLSALKVLAAFARKTSASSIRWQGNATLNSRLLAIAHGWGGKEEVRPGFTLRALCMVAARFCAVLKLCLSYASGSRSSDLRVGQDCHLNPGTHACCWCMLSAGNI